MKHRLKGRKVEMKSEGLFARLSLSRGCKVFFGLA